MREHLKGNPGGAPTDPPMKTALMWLAQNRPAEMSYLFPVGRDGGGKESSYLQTSGTTPPKQVRIREAFKRVYRACRDYGAWTALLFKVPHMENPAVCGKDMSRGYIADMDESFRNGVHGCSLRRKTSPAPALAAGVLPPRSAVPRKIPVA